MEPKSDKPITVTINPRRDVRAALKRASREGYRSVSKTVLRYVEQGLIADGLLQPEPLAA